MEKPTKNVTVKNATYDRLVKLGSKGESFEHIISRLLNYYSGKSEKQSATAESGME